MRPSGCFIVGVEGAQFGKQTIPLQRGLFGR